MGGLMPGVLAVLFWLSAAILAYTYLGYPVLVGLLATCRPRPIRKSGIRPRVSFIIAAYNEEKHLRNKLRDTLSLDYPRDKLEIIVAADGSDDGTAAIAREFEDQGVRLVHKAGREGKSAALNRAVAQATGEILLFSDANTVYNPDAVKALVSNFADATVGGVCGRKILITAADREATEGETAYWGYESRLKEYESRLGSIVTADGEIFAMRRALYAPIPAPVVHDDMYLSVMVVHRGYRLVYEPAATSAEYASRTLADEFHLKIRYASGGFQILAHFPALLVPLSLFSASFLSHKVLRWLAPVFLILALITSALLTTPSYRLAFWGQIALYMLALTGLLVHRRGAWPFVYYPLYFAAMNTAALCGLVRYLSIGQTPMWRKAAR
jgi:biofilm PGA synthesis N-glycosyltransferase PgaC